MTALLVATGLAWLVAVWCLMGVLRSLGLMRRLRHLVAALIVTLISLLLSTVVGVRHFFHVFAGETLVARVTASRFSPLEFDLTYTPAGSGDSAPITTRLEGDQWVVSGGIVKWHPWLMMLGLTSYHKPLRLTGQFSDAAEQRAHLPTLTLLEPEGDRFWEALYWADPYLPFVEAVYGSAAYAYVEPGAVQEVYVTPSGYLIKRASSTP